MDNTYGITKTEIKRVQASKWIGYTKLGGLRILKNVLGPQNIVSIFIYRDLKDILQDLQHHCEEIQYEKSC